MRSRVRAFIDYMRFVYGSEWAYAVGFISSVLAVVVGAVEDDIPRDIVFTAGVGGAAISFVLVARDSLDLYQRWAGVELRYGGLRDSSAYFSGVQWGSTAEDHDDPDSGFVELAGSGDGETVQRIWRDAVVDRTLWSEAGNVPLELRRSRYLLPDKLRDIAPRALRATNSKTSGAGRGLRPIWFNGKLARLMTEPTVESLSAATLSVQSVSFFDGQASNELWSWTQVQNGASNTNVFGAARNVLSSAFKNFRRRDERFKTDPQTGQDGAEGTRSVAHQGAVDAGGELLGLSDACMANIVGISLMAITADGQVLFVRPSGRKSVLPNGFAASSSGSLDWADARRVQQRADGTDRSVVLRDVLFAGMLRELLEESQVRRDEIVEGSEHVTGYFRWLSRAAKPEFAGVVRLTVTLAELEGRKVKGAEKNYTAGRYSAPVGLLQEAAGSWSQSQEDLYTALHDQLPEGQRSQLTGRVPIGVSSIAAWCAAADFLVAHPQYLDGANV